VLLGCPMFLGAHGHIQSSLAVWTGCRGQVLFLVDLRSWLLATDQTVVLCFSFIPLVLTGWWEEGTAPGPACVVRVVLP
jgi:hypothetical protein